jgi:mannose-6-phosphate isomerase-like protein (cupin superfamily)
MAASTPASLDMETSERARTPARRDTDCTGVVSVAERQLCRGPWCSISRTGIGLVRPVASGRRTIGDMTGQQGGYRADVFAVAEANEDFRRVLATTRNTQLVVMTIPPGGEVGSEVHQGIDQVLIALEGTGVSTIEGVQQPFGRGDVAVVPEGTRHNFVNNGSTPLRIITVYGPPDHPPGTVHATKADADSDESDIPPQL